MRPVFIASYYSDFFFVRDLKIPYGMDQWKKLEPKTNALLFIRWLVILSNKDYQVIQGFIEEERLKAGSWSLNEFWTCSNQLELLLSFVMACSKSTNKEDYKLTQIHLNKYKGKYFLSIEILQNFVNKRCFLWWFFMVFWRGWGAPDLSKLDKVSPWLSNQPVKQQEEYPKDVQMWLWNNLGSRSKLLETIKQITWTN
jgi:hypothetical protein